MATEIEIKLSLSARAASALAKQAMLSNIERQRQLLINTYYDTQDKRLRRERMVVGHREEGREWLLSVKTAPMLSASRRAPRSRSTATMTNRRERPSSRR